jgi:predicted nucleic acid-binding protein
MRQDTAEPDQASDRKPVLTSRETPLLDVLMEVLHLLIGEEGVQGLLKAWEISPLVCVLDTNILLRDLVRTANMQERTGLIRAAQTGLVRLYASTTVRDEVPEKILLKQREMHFDDPGVALTTWNEMYTPLVTFLDPLNLRTSSKATKALQLRDRDDVATARIIELIHPDIIFSEDQDLQTFVTVAKEIWTQVAVALRDHAESGMVDVAISVGGGIVIQVSIASVSLVLRWLCSINRKVLLALAVIFGVALIIPQSRRFLLRQGQALLDLLLNEPMWESVKATSDFLLKNYQRRKASGKFLALHGRTAHPRTALEYLGMVLARTPVPLHVRRIVEQMEALGYVPRGAHPETYVRQLLNAHPLLFEKTSARHWRLVSHGRADEQGLV